MIKNKYKKILMIVIAMIIASSISVYATYNYFAGDIKYKKADGTEISVENALNDLYSQNKEVKYSLIENIWSSSSISENYTLNVEDSGIYLVGLMNSNQENVAGSILTSGEEVISKTLTGWNFYSTIKVIKVTKGDYIKISAYNQYSKINSFITKLHNINVNEIIASNIGQDKTASLTYTASNDGEKILAISFSNALNRSNSISYNGMYCGTYFRNNDDYIDYISLKKGTTVSLSAYGYNWGGGSVFILK